MSIPSWNDIEKEMGIEIKDDPADEALLKERMERLAIALDVLMPSCAVIVREALKTMIKYRRDLRVMYNRCITYKGAINCHDCGQREQCETMRVLYNGYFLEHGERKERE